MYIVWHIIAVCVVIFLVLRYFEEKTEEDNEQTHVEYCDRPVDKKLNKYIHEIVNSNGVIYRQHQREFKRLDNINKKKKKLRNKKLLNEFIERQNYIDSNVGPIQQMILTKYMKKIQPYLEKDITNVEVVSNNCDDALVLATELNSVGDIDVIKQVMLRIGRK